MMGLLLLLPGTASAVCSSATCTDLTAIDNTRAVVSAACDCSGIDSHRAYVKCAKEIIASNVKDGTLQRQCKRPVLRCESRSTCGKAKAKICCVTSPKGKVKALAIRGAKCPKAGNLCDHPMALADACTAEGACSRRKGIRSFKSVQKVLSSSCALPSCHSTFARQGSLVLETEDVSYKSLINRPAELAEAAGLVRVKPGDPAASFLVKKLRGEGPGLAMPDAGNQLAEPIITMIEDWIRRGAKSTAEECASPTPGGESLCDDEGTTSGDYHWEPLPALDPPPANEGIQLYTPKRNVDPGTEWETCYAIRPNWTQIAADIGLDPGKLPVINKQVYRMHPGSHHLLLYAYIGAHPEQWPTGYFPCVAANCVNPGDCPSDANGGSDDTAIVIPIGGTQVAGTKYEVTYPDRVGIPILTPDTVLIVNPHYTNPFQPPQETYGETWLNLTFQPKGVVPIILDGIFAINYGDLFVNPYETRTISRVWQPHSILGGAAEDAAIFQLFGHMHKRATEFQIDYVKGGACSGDGDACGRDDDCRPGGQTCVRAPDAEDTTIYYTTAWDKAPIVDFPSPYFDVDKNQGLRWTCTHQNGIQGDPAHPSKRCAPGCEACGWDANLGTCQFCRTREHTERGWDPVGQTCVDRNGPTPDPPTVYQVGQDMPLVFGQLADDDMCNMFGYFIKQSDRDQIK